MKSYFSNFITENKYRNVFLLLLIFIVTICIYYKSLNNQFLPDWDDGAYVTNNVEIKSLHGDSVSYTIKNAFTGFTNGHYHPLTTLSYAIEYNLFGADSKPFHTTNLFLHLLNVFFV